MERLAPASTRFRRLTLDHPAASGALAAQPPIGSATLRGSPTTRGSAALRASSGLRGAVQAAASPRIVAPPRGAIAPWWLRSRSFQPGALTVRWPRPATSLRWLTAAVVAVVAMARVASSMHPPLDVRAGLLFDAVTATAPLAVATVVALAVLRPRLALPVVLLLVPYWDAAQVSWLVGQIQIILQTVFVVALGIGAGFEYADWRARRHAEQDATASRQPAVATGRAEAGAEAGPRPAAVRLGIGAALALVSVATLSTLASPDRVQSFTVLLHGILEPVALAALAIGLSRSRRQLVVLLSILGLSVALGSALNLAQAVPSARSLSTLQAERLLFARLTYFNVGLFGEMLSMAAPLLLGALVLRGPLSRRPWTRVVVLLALALSLAALYLTFSKSAWLSTFAAVLTLFVLLAKTWRRRIGIVLAAVAISALAIPWPAAVLRPVAPAAAQEYQTIMVGLVGQSRYDSWDPAKLAGRGSLVERFYAAEAAVQMAIDHPLLGIGLDQFRTQYVSTYRPPAAKLALDSAHSFWPEVAAELGLPALAITVLLFLAAVASAWAAYRRAADEQGRRLAAVVLASLVAWLAVASMFAGDMYRPWRNMASDFLMMAVLVGVAFALPRLSGAPDGRPAKRVVDSL